MDLDSWYAEKNDDPRETEVKNSPTSSRVDNIQSQTARVQTRSPWKSWNFKEVLLSYDLFLCLCLRLFILVANGREHL
jgi:hypothetical protein